MEHQKINYQELGLDSLNDRGSLRYLCYLFLIVLAKMPPYLPIFMKYLLPSKGRNVIQVASNFLICRFELFQNSFLPFTISEWNKLDPDVRNAETYSLFRKNLLAFIRPIENSIYSIYDPLGIKLLHRLRLGFSHLREYKFGHCFADTVNPLYSCYLEIESTEYTIRCDNYATFRTILMND